MDGARSKRAIATPATRSSLRATVPSSTCFHRMDRSSNIPETKSMADAMTATPADCRADIPGCRFAGLSRPVFRPAPGKSPEPAGWKACPTTWTSRLALLILLCFTIFSSVAAESFKSADCLDCHLDPTTTRKVNGKSVALLFPTNSFARSVHAKLDCVDCHE